jgi:hypothetical protein
LYVELEEQPEIGEAKWAPQVIALFKKVAKMETHVKQQKHKFEKIIKDCGVLCRDIENARTSSFKDSRADLKELGAQAMAL